MRLLSTYAAVAVGLVLVVMPGALLAAQGDPLERLLDAIATVESHNDPTATGDTGRAAGTYQIHRSYWADATRILGVNWDYGESRDPQKARLVVRAYLCHYGNGRTLLEMARIHNGGPRGYEKAATLGYARKIGQLLHGEGQS